MENHIILISIILNIILLLLLVIKKVTVYNKPTPTISKRNTPPPSPQKVNSKGPGLPIYSPPPPPPARIIKEGKTPPPPPKPQKVKKSKDYRIKKVVKKGVVRFYVEYPFNLSTRNGSYQEWRKVRKKNLFRGPHSFKELNDAKLLIDKLETINKIKNSNNYETIINY